MIVRDLKELWKVEGSLWGLRQVAVPSRVFRVRKNGLVCFVPQKGEDAVSYPSVITDGEVTRSGSASTGLLGFGQSRLLESLEIGTAMYLIDIGESGSALKPSDGNGFRSAIKLRYRKMEKTRGIMSDGDSYAGYCTGWLYLQMSDRANTAETLARSLESVLSLDSGERGAVRISLGQTPEQVELAMGAPDQTVDLGAKRIWIYKAMKVVFIDGKVVDVQ